MTSHDLVLTVVEGGRALSDFRAAALLTRVQAAVPQVSGLETRFVHWVASESELTAAQRQTLEQLLTYGDPVVPGPGDGTLVVVAPRLGTVSPWASKATDIAHSCGLDVHRVERVLEVRLRAPEELSAQDWVRAAAVLHDRMTETVMASATR